jgi:hypothetical protein
MVTGEDRSVLKGDNAAVLPELFKTLRQVFYGTTVWVVGMRVQIRNGYVTLFNEFRCHGRHSTW